MRSAALVLGTAVLISACNGGGGGNTQEPPPTTSPEVPTTPYVSLMTETDLWNGSARYRRYDGSEVTRIDTLVRSEQGYLCYVRRDGDSTLYSWLQSDWQNTLECYDAEGHLQFSYQKQPDNLIADVLITPDQQVIMAELVATEENSDRFYLHLVQFSSTGTELNRQPLAYVPSEQDLRFYNYDGSTISSAREEDMLTDGNHPLLVENADVALHWANNSLHLLTLTYGLKLYRMTPELTIAWDTQVVPAHNWLWNNADSDLTVSPTGDLFVAFDIFDHENQIYQTHFSRELPKEHPYGDIAIAKYNAQGEFQQVTMASTADSENLKGIEYHNDALWLGGSVRLEKFTTPGDTLEWDFFLQQINPADGQLINHHPIDFMQEDKLFHFGLTPSGNFAFAGRTGYQQPDSNSQVSYGRGFVLETDQAGQITRSVTFSEPRDVSVRALTYIDNDQFVFGLNYDAPITHTCDHDNTLCYQKSAAGVSSLPH